MGHRNQTFFWLPQTSETVNWSVRPSNWNIYWSFRQTCVRPQNTDGGKGRLRDPGCIFRCWCRQLVWLWCLWLRRREPEWRLGVLIHGLPGRNSPATTPTGRLAPKAPTFCLQKIRNLGNCLRKVTSQKNYHLQRLKSSTTWSWKPKSTKKSLEYNQEMRTK